MLPNISPQLSARLDAASRTLYILWLALMMSVVAYGFAAFMIASQHDGMETGAPLPPVLFPVLALTVAITGILLYRQLTSPDRIRAAVRQAGSERDAALSEAELRLARVPPLVFTASILRWALFESVAIFGLVLAILHHSFEDFVPYGGAALTLMAMTPPKVRQVTLSAVPLLSSDGARREDRFESRR